MRTDSTLTFGSSVLTMRTGSDSDPEMLLSSSEDIPDSVCTFTDALGIINSVTYFGGRVQINLHQCKRLCDFYERARQFFDALKRCEVFVDKKLYNAALDVLTNGQNLIYGYLEESWLHNMKFAGVNQYAFAKIYVELEDCFRLIYEKSEVRVVGDYYTEYAWPQYKGLEGSFPPIEFDALAPLFFLDDDCRATLFEGDAQKDKEHMLELMKGSGALDNEEGLLKMEFGGLLNIMEEALGMDMLKTEQVEEFEEEQRKQEEPAGEDSIQEAQEVPEQEVLNEAKVSPSKDTGLPQDFKIRSTEISVLEKIGSGAFATVRKCRWQNYDYAVKIFEGGDVDSLRAEVQNLVLLPRHPNIVLLVGFSIPKRLKKPMLVMELLDGDLHSLICSDKFRMKHQLTLGSLKEILVSRLRNGCCLGGQPDLSTLAEVGNDSTPIKVAVDFIYQIAKGMLFLHNSKIFHGDLKCKNVLVKQLPDGRFQLKIADFGVSEKFLIKRRQSDNDSSMDLDCTQYSDLCTQVHGNIGTLRWMAPEVYGVTDGDMKPYSMKADVYSFAMTCVEILTRNHPFPDWDASRRLKEHVKLGGRPYLSRNISRDLRELVESCWDADPLRRPDFSEIYSRMQKLKNQWDFSSIGFGESRQSSSSGAWSW